MLGGRAEPAAADFCDAGRRKPASGEKIQIREEFSVLLRRKRRCRTGIRANERFANVFADLVGLRSDPRANVGDQSICRYVHRPNRVFEDSGSKPAPAGVGNPDGTPAPIAEQYGQAVGGQDRANNLLLAGHGTVCLGFRRRACRVDHRGTVNLLQPRRFRGQAVTQDGAIARDMPGIVADPRPEVEARVRPCAHTA